MAIFKSNIPLGSDIISVSQGDLLGNNNWMPATMGKDHQIAPFPGNSDSATTFEGRHIQVCLNDRTGTEPNPAVIGDGTDSLLFSAGKVLYWRSTNAGQTNPIEMTSDVPWSIAGSYALFGTNTNYPQVPAVATQFGGWSFLPGFMLMQWGRVDTPGSSSTVVKFPITFSAAPFTIQLTPRNDGSHSAFTYYLDGAPTATQFAYRGSTGGSNALYWLAIGPT